MKGGNGVKGEKGGNDSYKKRINQSGLDKEHTYARRREK